MIKQLIIIIVMATNVSIAMVIISIIKISLVAHFVLEVILNVFLLFHFQTSENILYSLLFYANFTIRKKFCFVQPGWTLAYQPRHTELHPNLWSVFPRGSRSAVRLFLSTHHMKIQRFIKALGVKVRVCVKIPLSESSQEKTH